MGEKEKWNSLSIVKRWNWRLEGGERLPVEWRALPPGAMVRSQPEMLLRAMFESVQGSMSMSIGRITTRDLENLGVSLVGTAAGTHVNIPGA